MHPTKEENIELGFDPAFGVSKMSSGFSLKVSSSALQLETLSSNDIITLLTRIFFFYI